MCSTYHSTSSRTSANVQPIGRGGTRRFALRGSCERDRGTPSARCWPRREAASSSIWSSRWSLAWCCERSFNDRVDEIEAPADLGYVRSLKALDEDAELEAPR